ncbi:MAG: hypothetical protein KC620_26005, partial [Myxococcales bacterium]|nr:hypothetical protein [Myxococcales bacterium]
RAPRALFVNTAQRYGYGPPVEHSPADVCHRPEHLFNAATWLAARALSPVQVVQLHGFDAESVPEGVMAILSEGRPQPASAALSEQAARLKGAFSGDVRRFPDDITVLGGTTNVQGRLLAGLPGVRFVHVEMSVALRARLRKTAAARNALAEALFAPLGGSAP